MALRLLAILAVVLSGFAGFGCESSPRMGRYDVKVSLSEAYAREGATVPTLEVDLVGAGSATASRLSDYPLSQYFASNDRLREGLTRKTLVFSNDSREPKTLSANDEIWQRWEGESARELFVLVNLLGFEDRAGTADPRRLVLPLDRRRWKGRQIEVEIRPSGVLSTTPMEPVRD